jgi:hypothetical protein
MNTATDNYTCEERLTAAGKVHRVHEGRVVKPMKSLPNKTLKTTRRTTHNKYRMLLRKSLGINSEGREVPRYSNETECPLEYPPAS